MTFVDRMLGMTGTKLKDQETAQEVTTQIAPLHQAAVEVDQVQVQDLVGVIYKLLRHRYPSERVLVRDVLLAEASGTSQILDRAAVQVFLHVRVWQERIPLRTIVVKAGKLATNLPG